MAPSLNQHYSFTTSETTIIPPHANGIIEYLYACFSCVIISDPARIVECHTANIESSHALAKTIRSHGQFVVGLLAIHGKRCGLYPITRADSGQFQGIAGILLQSVEDRMQCVGPDIKCGDPVQFDKMSFSPKLFLEGQNWSKGRVIAHSVVQWNFFYWPF